VRPPLLRLRYSHAQAGTRKPSGYSFLPELDWCAAQQVSIEAAQPRLDLSILATLPSRTIVLGVLDLGDPAAETVEAVAARISAALSCVAPSRLVLAPDCGMKYLARDLAFAKLQAMAGAAKAL